MGQEWGEHCHFGGKLTKVLHARPVKTVKVRNWLFCNQPDQTVGSAIPRGMTGVAIDWVTGRSTL